MDSNQIGPIDISMSGCVPLNSSYNIYADGKLLSTIERSSYKALTLRVFNVKTIHIEMVGPTTYTQDEVIVHPMFNTIIKTHLRW